MSVFFVTGNKESGKTTYLAGQARFMKSCGKKVLAFICPWEHDFKKYKLRENLKDDIDVYDLTEVTFNSIFKPEDDNYDIDYDCILVDDIHAFFYDNVGNRLINRLLNVAYTLTDLDLMFAGYKINPNYNFTGTKRMTIPHVNTIMAISDVIQDLSQPGICEVCGAQDKCFVQYMGGDRSKKENYQNICPTCFRKILSERKGLGL